MAVVERNIGALMNRLILILATFFALLNAAHAQGSGTPRTGQLADRA
jgi:hypothetical protein